MTAIAISGPGGPRVLKPETRDVPQPGPGEILIKVPDPMTSATCATKRIEVSVELDAPLHAGDVIEAGSSNSYTDCATSDSS